MTTTISGTTGVTYPVQAGGTSQVQSSSGKVLQVVNSTYSTSVSTTSTTFVTTNLAATITPTSTTSKILILVSLPIYVSPTAIAYAGIFTVFRGTVAGTDLSPSSFGFGLQTAAINQGGYSEMGITVLDSPSTTSAQTYTVGMRSENSSLTTYVCLPNNVGTITLMEIAA